MTELAQEAALADEHASAADLAGSAGRRLISLRERSRSNAELLGSADFTSHTFLLDELSRLYPSDAVRSEEGRGDAHHDSGQRLWVIDPLDGTREFCDPPRQDWAVHVALVVDGLPVVGAVALPARRLTLSTASPPRLPPLARRPLRVLVSRTRPTELGRVVADKLGGELIPMGSAGAKAMAVVLGEAEVYVHSGGQYEWDTAAPAAVAIAAGLHVSRLDGSALLYGRPDPWLPEILVCRPELADLVLTLCTAS
ncbi:MAG TPA: 3'(2'),5'-bisphosphate nucleotidase CysQ [Candidatus Dormibacteraeota bacterium]|nr:3'(2'),5'-bisphosphate nucleotidase CysQ [Candidatus Dormibacteraeota bacterium]